MYRNDSNGGALRQLRAAGDTGSYAEAAARVVLRRLLPGLFGEEYRGQTSGGGGTVSHSETQLGLT